MNASANENPIINDATCAKMHDHALVTINTDGTALLKGTVLENSRWSDRGSLGGEDYLTFCTDHGLMRVIYNFTSDKPVPPEKTVPESVAIHREKIINQALLLKAGDTVIAFGKFYQLSGLSDYINVYEDVRFYIRSTEGNAP